MKLEEIAHFAEDVDRVVEFYQQWLGGQPAVWTRGQTAIFQVGDVKLFLHQKMRQHEPGWPLQDEDHISFAVENVDQTCEELRRRGLQPEVGPREFYWECRCCRLWSPRDSQQYPTRS